MLLHDVTYANQYFIFCNHRVSDSKRNTTRLIIILVLTITDLFSSAASFHTFCIQVEISTPMSEKEKERGELKVQKVFSNS